MKYKMDRETGRTDKENAPAEPVQGKGQTQSCDLGNTSKVRPPKRSN